MKKFLLCLTILLSTTYFLTAQCDGTEDGNTCSTAVISCNLGDPNTPINSIDMCNANNFPGQPSPLCPNQGNSTANNISWISFTAGNTDITFTLNFQDCTTVTDGGGNPVAGAQYGIYESCDFDEVIACDGNANQGLITISSDEFILGNTYIIFVDGFAGSCCQVDFEVISGGEEYEVPDSDEPDNNFDEMAFDPPLDDQQVCLGGEVNFNTNVPTGGNETTPWYRWTIDPPTSDYPDGIVNPGNNSDYNFNILFNEVGTYKICGFAFTCCDTSNIECATYEVVALPLDDLGMHEYCTEDLLNGVIPPGWGGTAITSPGEYTVDLEDPIYTCEYTQNVVVEAFDTPPVENVYAISCETTYDICNITIPAFQNQPTTIVCPGADMNGCDSTISLSLYYVNVVALLEDPICNNGMLEFSFELGGYPGGSFDVTYNFYKDGEVFWTETAETFNYNTDVITVPIDDGIYYLEVLVERFGQSCLFTSTPNSIFVTTDNLLPDEPELGNWALNPCILDSLSYQLSANNDPNNTYLWDITPSTGLIIEDDSSSVIGINWENANISQTYTICVTADNGCGKSDQLCEDINVIGQPVASYTLADTMCITDVTVVTYNGTNISGGGTYTWNFDGGTIAQGNSNNAGPFDLSYATTGKKFVTLSVNQGSCASDAFIDSIVVVNPLDPPLINCMSSTDSIGFSWADLTGDYEVNVIDAPGTAVFNQDGASFSVTGLTPGDVVEIEVIAVDNGVCGNVSAIFSCIAQNCPPIPIELPTIDTICLNGSAGTIDLDAVVDDPSGNGVESWTGNGIIDGDEGIFDPSIALPGTHQIVFNYTTDCPYTDALTIVVLEQPISTFEVEDTICISDFVTVNFTGTFSNSTFDWDFDGGINTGNNAGPFDISWDTPGLKTISLGVSNLDCSSQVETRSVLVQEELLEPEIMCDAQTNDITFTWDPVSNATNYEIFINGDSQGLQTGTSYFVDGLEPGNMVDITVVVYSDNKCSDVSSFTSCIALNCPPVVVDVSAAETSICLDNNTTAFQIDSEVLGGNSEAILTWSGAGVNNMGVFDPTLAGEGMHEVILTYNFSSCVESDTIVFNILPTPTASFTIENSVCITDSFHVEFTGDFEDLASFVFDLDGGNISGADPGPYVVWFDNSGTYDIELLLEEDNCFSSPYIETVTVEEELNLPNPGFSCDPTTGNIEFSWPSVDCAAEYIVFVNGSEVATITGNSYNVDNLEPEVDIEFEIIAVSECACGDVVFSTNCSTNACSQIMATFENVPSMCLGDDLGTTQLNINIEGNPTVSNESWNGTGINDNGVFDPNIAGPGLHTIDYNFDVENCNYAYSTTIEIFESPTAEINFSDPSCPGEKDGMISVEPSGGSGEYEVFLNNIPFEGNSIDTLLGNSYSILVVDENNCSFFETIVLTTPTDQATSIVGSNTVISTDTSTYTLDTDVPLSDITNITWFDTTGVVYCNDPGCLSVDINPENDLMVCVLVEYGDGCSTESCINIRSLKIKQVFVPNTFSPDDDGVNDLWTIFPNDEIVAMPLVQVFNRWGEKMFERKNLTLDGNSPGWDGSFKGSKLNPGVYVYRLDLVYKDGTTESISGDITIMR